MPDPKRTMFGRIIGINWSVEGDDDDDYLSMVNFHFDDGHKFSMVIAMSNDYATSLEVLANIIEAMLVEMRMDLVSFERGKN